MVSHGNTQGTEPVIDNCNECFVFGGHYLKIRPIQPFLLEEIAELVMVQSLNGISLIGPVLLSTLESYCKKAPQFQFHK